MSYIVLARKYRPQNFKEVVGQEAVSQTLAHAIEANRVAHAYIFSGPRGIGKTTIARILAKCLNCEKGITTAPCNKCASCVSISRGASVEDVLEIDGASNRGIDQIRDLRDSAKYTPARSRFRIFIIDEAHQITKDAFGALLKILEEPPAHVVFMMATTEVQKVPAPILSRCQRFSLKPIPPEKLLAHLKKICAEEKIKADDEALADIVRFVEGSLRDALSLLDQAVVYAEEGVTSQTLRELLGLLPKTLVRNFARKLLNSEPGEILQSIDQAVKDGVDLTQLGRDIQNYYHELLLAKAGVEDPLNKDYSTLAAEARSFDFNMLERNIRLLSRMLEDMRRSETPRAVFDIYTLRIAQKVLNPREILARLENLEKGGGTSPSDRPSMLRRSSGDVPPFTPSIDNSNRQNVAASEGSVIASEAKQSHGIASPAREQQRVRNDTNPAPSPSVDIASLWPGYLEEIGREKQVLASALEEAEVSLSDGRLWLTFQNSFSKDLVQRSEDYLKSFLSNHLGKPLAVQTTLKPAERKTKAEKPAPPKAPEPRDGEDAPDPKSYQEIPPEKLGEDVQKVLKHFPGVVKKEK